MKVRAAVAREGQRLLSIEDLDLSDPGPDGILVRIVGAGLCHTDVKTLQGEMAVPKPVVLGHEGAGIVERTGERITKVKPGDPVVLTFDSCGTCRPCSTGNPAYCAQNMALNFRDAREGAPGSFRKGSKDDSRTFLRPIILCQLRGHNLAQHDSRTKRFSSGNSRCARLRHSDRRRSGDEFSPTSARQLHRHLRRRSRGPQRRNGSCDTAAARKSLRSTFLSRASKWPSSLAPPALCMQPEN